MKALLSPLILLTFALPAFAQTPEPESAPARPLTRYFEHKSQGSEIRISLIVEGDGVHGAQFSGSDEPETHGASGTITGNVKADGILHVTYNYTIEESAQSEEQLLKLDGTTLYLGEGPLEEHGPGQMVLQDPKSVKFEKALKEISVKEFESSKKDGKAITKVLQEPVAKLVGAPVVFEGTVRVSQQWARFHGSVSVAEGKKAKDEATAKALENGMLRAYMKDDGKGGWKLVRFIFEDAGDLSVPTDGQDFDSPAPWLLELEPGIP